VSIIFNDGLHETEACSADVCLTTVDVLPCSCSAVFITLRTIIIVELLGIQQLTNAYGLSCLFLGIAYIAGSPISGLWFNLTLPYCNRMFNEL